ncbi:enolase C-terminal domain-like protein [Mucilaginibacter litoreus]|uniref:Enolase C-terminal domain-like protein n=1 Tax=Mucilaginibacter litoreus TaxID=1048221 RepID=A0ABW3AWD9_9SPHI
MEKIMSLSVSVYTVPTDRPESDGTLEWNSTTMILVELAAAGKMGMGYTYAAPSLAGFIDQTLKPLVVGHNPLNTQEIFKAMEVAIRNEGNCGMARMALSAVDNALWDLKAKILDLPLCSLIGTVRSEALVYGSGGFTSYTDHQLEKQLGGWAEDGLINVKMKVGRHPGKDLHRVKTARKAIGKDVELYVDANGAYDTKQSLEQAEKFTEHGVTWFEEPVSSDNLKGLHLIREHAPHTIKIAAGEYGYNDAYFLNMLEQGAVDVLQADATRCGGITGFLKAGQLCEAFQLPFSFHCAPAMHLHASLCLNAFFIGEYFHDHVRIEQLFFDGAIKPEKGYLKPDLSRPGYGLDFKERDAAPYKVA